LVSNGLRYPFFSFPVLCLPILFHLARHSFGTFLISADIPIESIAKMMGHSNIRTTQGYARITDDKISKDMDKLMERRKKQSTGEKTNKSN
ncbi:tyrosine-type recombinase/integrase, partial [Phocaeicola vulgatus]|uniref:tyrosine-type recombinase/integrase n=1 Tax=Phocaeicola vulgatus TaxID=821 RepID=UPI001EEF1A68